MRILAATLLLATACGSPQKKDSAIVQEGSDLPATCCCKTVPDIVENNVTANYAMTGRMECSTQHGDCEPDVQCNGNQEPSMTPVQPKSGEQKTGDSPPPPPDLPEGQEAPRTP